MHDERPEREGEATALVSGQSSFSHPFWTPDEIVAALRRFYRQNSRAPREREWRNAGRGHPCSATIMRAFGSWRLALEAAGMTPAPRSDAKWTADRIVEVMLDFLLREGHWPSQWDWQRASSLNPPANTVIYVFGSWTAAKRAAGWAKGESPAPRPRAMCIECGGDPDSSTIGCVRCGERAGARKRRQRRASRVLAVA